MADDQKLERTFDITASEPSASGVLDTVGSRPLVLKMEFDPGWEGLRDRFGYNAIGSDRQLAYARSLYTKNPVEISFRSTKEFFDLLLEVAQRPALYEAAYVNFNTDVRKLDSFVIDTPEKMKALYESMVDQRLFKSKTNIESMSGKSSMSAFPRVFLFEGIPSRRDDYIPAFQQSRLRATIPQSELVRDGNSYDGAEEPTFLVGLQADLTAFNSQQRKSMQDHERLGIIAIPTIDNLEDAKRLRKEIFMTRRDGHAVRLDLKIAPSQAEQIVFLHDSLAAIPRATPLLMV